MTDFHMTMLYVHGGGVGKELEYPMQYAKEFYFIINNDEYKEVILQTLKDADWCKIYPMTKTPNLLHWQVYKYLKTQIPELK